MKGLVRSCHPSTEAPVRACHQTHSKIYKYYHNQKCSRHPCSSTPHFSHCMFLSPFFPHVSHTGFLVSIVIFNKRPLQNFVFVLSRLQLFLLQKCPQSAHFRSMLNVSFSVLSSMSLLFKVPPFTLLPTFLALFFYYNTSLSVFKYVMFSMFLFTKV